MTAPAPSSARDPAHGRPSAAKPTTSRSPRPQARRPAAGLRQPRRPSPRARAASPPLPLPHGAVLGAPERWGRYKGVEVTQKGRRRDGTGAAVLERPSRAPSRGPRSSRDPGAPLGRRLRPLPRPRRAQLFPRTAPPSPFARCSLLSP